MKKVVCDVCGRTFGVPNRSKCTTCALCRTDEEKTGTLKCSHEPRQCANCSREFTPNRPWQRFCSPKCKKEFHYMMHEIRLTTGPRFCKDCGEEYEGDGRYRYCPRCRERRNER